MTEDKMVGWHHRLNGHEFGWTVGVGHGGTGRPSVLRFMESQRVGHNCMTELILMIYIVQASLIFLILRLARSTHFGRCRNQSWQSHQNQADNYF